MGNPFPPYEAIATGLAEFGASDTRCRTTAYLIRGGHCVGQRLRFDGVDAVWLLAEHLVHFYDGHGRLLKTVVVASPRAQEAA